jgi:3D (Asp-Asp-Asp) domain-containing protein/peptidoglycan hydrolase CwlO-like protein
VRGLTPGSRGRVAAVSVAAGLVLSVPAGSSADPAAKAAALRNAGAGLQAQTHRALLDLYSLETQLAAANSRLGSLHAQVSQVRAQQVLVRRQVSITRRALTVSQQQLGERLKLLYEQGQPDSLAVILGSTSLDEAITNLDELNRAARQSQSVIDQTTATRRSLDHLSARLDARNAELADLEQQTAASAAALDAARQSRAGFVSSLRTKERLNRATIASLEATAQAAQAKSQALTVVRGGAAPETSPAAAPVPPFGTTDTPPSGVPSPGSAAGRTLTVSSTGYSLPGHTATGLPVGWGIVAVDPAVIPLGTHLTIPGYGEAVAADTGSAVRGATIDLWFPTLAQAMAWGRRTVTITLH